MTIKQALGIPVGIDPAPFWANLFKYSYEEEYISSLISFDKIKARHFHSTRHFIVDLYAINGKSIFDIYPKELEVKVGHQGDHATFLNLDLSIKEGTFIYKLFDKRDSFSFSSLRMSHKKSNIPQNIFYSATKGDFLRIYCSALCLRDFIPKAKEIIERTKQQGFKRCTTGTISPSREFLTLLYFMSGPPKHFLRK